MDLRHLRYFVAVSRERSFTRAAEALNMAQPPLSRQIQQLEAELGLVLVKRDVRPLELTEAGRLILEQASLILERVEDLQALALRLQGSRRNVFRIGFVPSTLYGKLPDVIRAHRAERPCVELVLAELLTIEQMTALKENRIDVGFGRIPFEDPAITRLLLRNEKLVVALPSEHPIARRRTSLRLRELETEHLIVYPRAPRPSYADQVLAALRERGVRPRSLQEVRELQTALGLVAAGLGVCLVPAAVERLRRDNVVYRSLDEERVFSPIFMSFRTGDASPEIPYMLRLVKAVYEREGIAFGR
jgi:DNA-binding transcriptional LysR family regulator